MQTNLLPYRGFGAIKFNRALITNRAISHKIGLVYDQGDPNLEFNFLCVSHSVIAVFFWYVEYLEF